MSHRVHAIQVGTTEELAVKFFGINDLAMNTDTGAIQLSNSVGPGSTSLQGDTTGRQTLKRENELPIANGANGFVGTHEVPAGPSVVRGGLYAVETVCIVKDTTTGAPLAVLKFFYFVTTTDTGEANLNSIVYGGNGDMFDRFFTVAGTGVVGAVEVLPTGECGIDINNVSGGSITIETITTVHELIEAVQEG